MVRTDSFKKHIATQTLLSNSGSRIKHLISNSSFDDGFGALNYKAVQNQRKSLPRYKSVIENK